MINNVTLLGRLTAAPELKATNDGTSVLTFCIAVDRRIQTKEGERQADFINCVAWRQTAEFISKYFKKGELIALIGEIQTRNYKYKGENRTAVEVKINEASFTGGKINGDSTGGAPVEPDDIPF